MYAILPIHPGERIIRGIFSPLNIHKKTGKLKPNIYILRPFDEGVSVLRPDISSIDECRKHFKNIENVKKGRSYWGMGLLYANEIHEIEHQECTVDVIPKESSHQDYILYQHAEIYFYMNRVHFNPTKIETQEVGLELPPDIVFMAEKLAEKTVCFQDSDIQSEVWNGSEIVKDERVKLTIDDFQQPENPDSIIPNDSKFPNDKSSLMKKVIGIAILILLFGFIAFCCIYFKFH